jgi:hypothetical protein
MTRNRNSPYAKYHCESKEYDGGFGRQVLGEKWVAHYGAHAKEATRGRPNAAMKNHPILKGVNPIWCPSDVYEVHPPSDVEVLVDGHVLTGMDPADGDKAGMSPLPVAWIRQPNAERGTGRRLLFHDGCGRGHEGWEPSSLAGERHLLVHGHGSKDIT